MAVYERRSPMPCEARDLFAWHCRERAFQRLSPPWEDTHVVAQDGNVVTGGTVELRTKIGPFPRKWIARHEPATQLQFVDRQTKGPFKQWVHTHTAIPDGDASILQDHVDYRLPLGALGRVVAGRSVHKRLDKLFTWRHARMQHDLVQPASKQKIAITGATGLLGGELHDFLATRGHAVRPAGRPHPGADDEGLMWDPEKGLVAHRRWSGLDAVVHYAGETIAQRWTEAAKKRIWDSRVPATRHLCEDLAALDEPPKTLISASAIGYYGDHPESVDEDGARGEGWLAELCEAWEGAADAARDAGIRVVHPRTSLVMSAKGGALPPMLTPARLGVGGPIAGGKQSWPWIHIDDHVYAVNNLLHNDVEGPVNLNAGVVTQKEFAKTLGRVIRRPSIAPLPHFAVKMMFGQMGTELFTYGQNLDNKVLRESGFTFAHPDLEEALRFELGRMR